MLLGVANGLVWSRMYSKLNPKMLTISTISDIRNWMKKR